MSLLSETCQEDNPDASWIICAISKLYPLQNDIQLELKSWLITVLPPTRNPKRKIEVTNSSTISWFAICFFRTNFIAGLFMQTIWCIPIKKLPRIILEPLQKRNNRPIQQKLFPNIFNIGVFVASDKIVMGDKTKFINNWHIWKIETLFLDIFLGNQILTY